MMKLFKVSSLTYQKCLFTPLFVFLSPQSAAMWLKKSLNWEKNATSSVSAGNFKQLQ
jgi:hypothetical protein